MKKIFTCKQRIINNEIPGVPLKSASKLLEVTQLLIA